MLDIDWKDKLVNAKFWAAVIGFVTAMLVAFNVPEITIGHVVAIISAAAVLIAFILGEGFIEVARINGEREKAALELESHIIHHELDLEELYLKASLSCENEEDR